MYVDPLLENILCCRRKTMVKTMDKFRVRITFVLMVISGLGALSSVLLAKGTLTEIEEEKSKQQ